MIPWTLLAAARIPGGAGEMRLVRRGAEFCILIGAEPLMNSRLSGSEEALARLACTRLGTRSRPKILIGGLGMGFTLRAALAVLAADAQVVVAELVPAVVAWARGPMAELFGGCLDDPRVTILEGDVGTTMAAHAGRWDAILLDVDNGPDAVTHADNEGLYAARGLGRAHRALRPAGLLAVWSAARDPAFAIRMQHAGFMVEELRVRAHAGKGARHTIWIGRKA